MEFGMHKQRILVIAILACALSGCILERISERENNGESIEVYNAAYAISIAAFGPGVPQVARRPHQSNYMSLH